MFANLKSLFWAQLGYLRSGCAAVKARLMLHPVIRAKLPTWLQSATCDESRITREIIP